MSGPTLSPQVFAILSSLVEERLGIHYGPEDLEIFSSKVSTRIEEAGFSSALDYYYFLRYDEASKAEFDALTEAIVVGETYLFREAEPLRAALTHVVEPAIARRGKARVLSAACATGEEPFTMAILLAERGMLDAAEIVGVDVSARALAKAREGVYARRSLRALPAASSPWLAADKDGVVTMDRRLRDRIEFRWANLVHPSGLDGLGEFDLILCRNVLIYFQDENVQKVVSNLAEKLGEGGRLLVGASESLLRFGTAVRCEERGGAFLYARTEAL